MSISQRAAGFCSASWSIMLVFVGSAFVVLGAVAADLPAEQHTSTSWVWTPMKVQLPVSNESFPLGDGSEAATSFCLICHSAGMVLRQPPMMKADWRAEIMKMRSAYGAPVPDEQVEKLAEYLAGIPGQRGL